MGIPANVTITPPKGDLANAVLQGTLTAVSTSSWWMAYGAFNFTLYGTAATSLTTTANSNSASVSSGTGIAAGRVSTASTFRPARHG